MAAPSGVTIKLGGKNRTLRYTNRALVRLEEETGLTIAQAGHRMGIGSLKAVSAVVWAGLLHDSPDLERDEVLDLIDLPRLEEISDAAAEAISKALGTPEEKEESPEKKGSKSPAKK